MDAMFNQAAAFNQPVDSWNVGVVTSMDVMFQLAAAFNQPVDSWNVGSVTSMEQMFYQAVAFNQPLAKWGVQPKTVLCSMFSGALQYNQNLTGTTLAADRVAPADNSDDPGYRTAAPTWNATLLTMRTPSEEQHTEPPGTQASSQQQQQPVHVFYAGATYKVPGPTNITGLKEMVAGRAFVGLRGAKRYGATAFQVIVRPRVDCRSTRPRLFTLISSHESGALVRRA